MARKAGYDDEIDLKKLFLKYLARWYIFAACLVVAIIAAFMFNTLSEPVYRVKSMVLISEEGRPSPVMPEITGLMQRESWHNQRAILQSHTLVSKAIENMDSDVDVSYYAIERRPGFSLRNEIYTDSPFRVVWDKNSQQPFGESFRVEILGSGRFSIEGSGGSSLFSENNEYEFGYHFNGNGYSFRLELRGEYNDNNFRGDTYEFVIHDEMSLLNDYMENLDIEPMGRDYSIVEVFFQATNRQRAFDFVNSLTSTYLQQNLEEKNQTAVNTEDFINSELEKVTASLEETEVILQNYREKHQVMEVDLIATHLFEELKELDREYSIEQVKREYYDLLVDYVHDDVEFSEVFGPSALGIEDPLLNNLLIELSNLYNERARLLLTTTKSTPSVQIVEEKIRQSKATLKENIQSLQSASDIMVNNLSRRIEQNEERINRLPQTERDMIKIQRLFSLNEATYNFLMEKRAEAGIAKASNIPDHKIIDPARPDPMDNEGIVSPRPVLNYAIAIGLGLILPLIFLVLREFLNTRITDKDEVTSAVDFPVVGLLPHHKELKHAKEPKPVIFDQKRMPLVEALRSLRSNLQFYSPKKQSKLIAITSTRGQEGKTSTAVNLAASIAMLDRKVIYIDADMRKPSVSLNGDIWRNRGLSNYLAGQFGMEDIISQSSENKNFYMISSGTIPPNAAELMEREEMDRLLENLGTFEYILIDTPPVGLVSDAQHILSKADVILYILRHGYSRHTDLEFLNEYSENTGLKNIVIAINAVKSPTRYGYGYGYGYGVGVGR